MPTGHMTSTIADAPSTPYPVHGSQPGCEGKVTVDQNGTEIAKGIGAAISTAITGEPISGSIIGVALANVIPGLRQKSQSNGNCALACIVVPEDAKVTDIMCYVSFQDPQKHASAMWTPFPQGKWGAGNFPYAYWDPHTADTPIPGDAQHRRVITKRMTNWSDTTELFGRFVATITTP